MSFRWIVLPLIAMTVLPAARLVAQDAPAVDNSKTQFEGVINNASVFVRSGPGANYYPTQKLDKGAHVTVVGIKFGWLKIAPPDGSFSYIAVSSVQLAANSKTAKVTRNIYVRAGSVLNTIKTTVQGQLNIGDTVEVLGEDGEYLKIKPPSGAYLYVSQDLVDMVRPIASAETASPATPAAVAPAASGQPTAASGTTGQPQPAAPAQPPAVTAHAEGAIPAPTAPSLDATPKTTDATPAQPVAAATPAPTAPQAVATTQPTVVAAAPATQPAQPSADEQFANFEAEFNQMSKLPLADQSIDQLATKYKSIAKADGLSDTLKQVVTIRIATLKGRADSQAKLAEARQIEKDNAEKQLALQAEQQELAERLKKADIQLFTAVGTLQTSSLQVGSGVLYRLTDPATGRTLIYLRSDSRKMTALIGQFVGVTGEQTTDPQNNLRMISPKDIEVVDAAKVNSSIAAEIVPPSLLARNASASSSPQDNP